MASEEQTRAPFNEQAALAELERLQRALEESRRRRKHATAAFDDFVGSFRREPAAVAEPMKPQVERQSLSTIADTPPSFDVPEPAAARPRMPRAGMLAGAAVAVAAGIFFTRSWRSAPAEPTSGATSTATPSAVESAAAATPAASTPRAAATAALEAELTAARDVWVRATVDGERVLERELEAGARVPLRASQSIVIRAGDAGAVRIAIGGRDLGPLGPNGQVVTRTFTSNSTTAR